MALKQRMSVMVDESLGALNMPTRSELRTLQDRLQETRRENKRLRRTSSPCSVRSPPWPVPAV
jgi:polyhydroxyalkanoate synthase subunit PhaE